MKRLYILILGLVFIPSSVFASISYVDSVSGSISANSVLTVSKSFSCETDSLLLVGVVSDFYSITGVTYNGSPLTKIDGISLSSDSKEEIWYLINPDCGSTHDLTITQSGAGDLYTDAAYYNGVDQSTVYDDFNSNQNNSTGSNLVLSVASTHDNELYVVFANDNNGTPAEASFTQRLLTNYGVSGHNFFADKVLSTANGANTTAITGTFRIIGTGVSLIEASSGGGSGTTTATTTVFRDSTQADFDNITGYKFDDVLRIPIQMAMNGLGLFLLFLNLSWPYLVGLIALVGTIWCLYQIGRRHI